MKMELHDICNGCSRHPAVCMCSVSIGPEGATSFRPDPASLASKYRIIANDARRKNRETEESQTPIARCRWRAFQAAKQGQLSAAILAYTFNLPKEEIDVIVAELQRDGFRCDVSIDYAFLHLYWE
jgi:hypothetical protein